MANLIDKIDAEIQLMEDTLRELAGTMSRPTQELPELMAIAGFISNLYHGVENVLKLNLKLIKVQAPRDSASSHRDLLTIAYDHGIISSKLRQQLDEYRAFRHFFVHAYGLYLDPDQLNPLAQGISEVFQRFQYETEMFCNGLTERDMDKNGKR